MILKKRRNLKTSNNPWFQGLIPAVGIPAGASNVVLVYNQNDKLLSITNHLVSVSRLAINAKD